MHVCVCARARFYHFQSILDGGARHLPPCAADIQFARLDPGVKELVGGVDVTRTKARARARVRARATLRARVSMAARVDQHESERE